MDPTSGPTAEGVDITNLPEGDVDWKDLVEKESVPAPAAPSRESVPEPAHAPAPKVEPEPAKTDPAVVAPIAQPAPKVETPPPAPVVADDDPVTEFLHAREKRPLKKSEAQKLLDDAVNSAEYRRSGEESIRAAKKLAQQAEARMAEADAAIKERDTLKAQVSAQAAQEELAKLNPGDEPDRPERGDFDDEEAYGAALAEYRTAHKAWKEKDRAFTIAQARPQAPVEPQNPLAFMTSEDYDRQLAEEGGRWMADHAGTTPELYKAVSDRVIAQINARYQRGISTPVAAVQALLDAALDAETIRRENDDLKRSKALSADAVSRGEANAREAFNRSAETPAIIAGTAAAPQNGKPDTDAGWMQLLTAHPDDENLASEYEAWYSKATLIKDSAERARVLGAAA